MGMPFIQHYMPADYDAGSQNWDIVQDNNGVIYVGNNKGLLQYDGKSWQLIQVSNNSTVRSLCHQDGIIYVGAENEIGYLEPTITGDLQYHSLVPYLDSAYHDFNITWNILGNHEGVYFRTSKYVLRWKDGKFKVWEPKTRFSRSFLLQDQYYIQERRGNLLTTQGDSLVIAPNGEKLKDMLVQAILPYETDKALILPNNDNAYILELKEGGAFTTYQGEAVNEFCKSGVIYDHGILQDGNYVVCTIGNGAIAFNKEGQIVQTINKAYGLADEVMICLFTDKTGNLWAGLNSGIAKIEMASPFRVWDDKQGLEGAVSNIIRVNQKLYASTVQGLYAYNGSQFAPIKGISEQTWEVLPYTTGENPRLLVGNYAGLYEVRDTTLKASLSGGSTAIDLLQKPDQPKIVFAARTSGLHIYQDNGNEWLELQAIKDLPGEIESLCDGTQKNKVWAAVNSHQVLSLEFPNEDYTQAPTIRIYDETKGIPDTDFSRVYQLQGKILAATQVGVLAYNPNTNAFEPYFGLGEVFAGGDEQVYTLQQGENNDIWVSGLYTSGLMGKVSYKDKQTTLLGAPFKRLPKAEMYNTYFDKESFCYWICADKLYRFDERLVPDQSSQFYTLIRQVIVNDDSTIFWGNNFIATDKGIGPKRLSNKQPKSLIAHLPYKDNTLTFEYAATSYDQEALNQFSYQLIGHDKEGQWSSWTTDSKKQYTDLYEGDYTFQVKAKNIYGQESEIAAYAFQVAPPWFRSIAAYIGYTLATIFIVFGIVKLNARRILIENKRLEDVVVKRTEEIQNKNEEIAQQNAVLIEQKATIEKKNKDTFDSIRYAERILNALHINPSELKSELPNSFVFFKPKDIVSGDFFWFTKSGDNLIIAAIDCTGHGIPGAFMSVIGQSLLKETVSMYGITEVDEILHSLHSMLTSSLSREKGASIEGMDMTIVSIDPINRQLHFAGAKNPLIFIRNGKLQIIKGDKMPVGGIRPDEERQFRKHTILLDAEPSVFYMYSDGFQDQFGGPRNRKFLPKKFRQLLFDIHQKDFEEQRHVLSKTFEQWKGQEKQLDDVLVVGFKL